MDYKLVIGNKNTSSWSLRPWLGMRVASIAFSEISINLRDADAKTQILRHSPSGKVPALLTSGTVVWDSLAILEFMAEAHPEARLWPQDRLQRAGARAVSAEMHSGFQNLRQECPMDFVGRHPKEALSPGCEADVRRIIDIWGTCRRASGHAGPFLFGAFSIADAMFAPVASRFRTYLPDLHAWGDDGTAARYVEALFALPAMREWDALAAEEVGARA